MKNLIYLFALMFVLGFMNSGCKKNDTAIIIPDSLNPEDLVGNWNFSKLVFHDTTHTGCDGTLNSYNLTTLSLDSITTTTVKINDACKTDGRKYPYTIDENLIIVLENENSTSEIYAFRILDPDKFDGKTLKLEFTSTRSSDTLPLGGTYTLTKQ